MIGDNWLIRYIGYQTIARSSFFEEKGEAKKKKKPLFSY